MAIKNILSLFILIILYSCIKLNNDKLSNSKESLIKECKCNIGQKYTNTKKSQFDNLKYLQKLVISNSNCERPLQGKFELDYNKEENFEFELQNIKLHVCDTIIKINEINYFKENFMVLDSCNNSSNYCSQINIRIEYDN